MQIVDNEPRTPFRVLLDDLTVARLIELAEVCHTDPSNVISAIVKDVLEDDARVHDGDMAAMIVTVQ